MKLKHNIIFLLTISLSINVYSQDNRILGNWKPVAIDNGEFYMNIETDSIALHEELMYIENDSLKLNQLKIFAKQLYFKQSHTFSENGKYNQNLIVMNLELDYKIDRERNLIIASENNFQDEKDTLELPYWIENDILYMEIPLTEPISKIWLKK